MEFGEKQDFSKIFKKEEVYKEVPELGAIAQSRSTDSINSKGSSARIVTSGPEDSSTSYRTPRPLLALAYRKPVKSPIGFPTLQFTGTLRGVAALDWQSIPGRESNFTWSSPGHPGSSTFDVRGGRSLHPVREAPQ